MDEVLFTISAREHCENGDQREEAPELQMRWRLTVPPVSKWSEMCTSTLEIGLHHPAKCRPHFALAPVSFQCATTHVPKLKSCALNCPTHNWDGENELKQMGISKLQIVGN